MFAKMRRRFGIGAHVVHTVTSTRELTPEEADVISARMDAAFERMGEAFAEMDKAFDVLRATDTHPKGRDRETGLGS